MGGGAAGRRQRNGFIALGAGESRARARGSAR